jgi:DNA-binding HxlR family transcriptional regulator
MLQSVGRVRHGLVHQAQRSAAPIQYDLTMRTEEYRSPAEVTISVVGGKWKILILCRLQYGIARFGELRKVIPGITQTMLTQQLRELEEDGVLQRKIYAEIPPRVEYSLTRFGQSLIPVLDAMSAWGQQYQKRIACRRRNKEKAEECE